MQTVYFGKEFLWLGIAVHYYILCNTIYMDVASNIAKFCDNAKFVAKKLASVISE